MPQSDAVTTRPGRSKLLVLEWEIIARSCVMTALSNARDHDNYDSLASLRPGNGSSLNIFEFLPVDVFNTRDSISITRMFEC